jgi:hypothetical protein
MVVINSNTKICCTENSLIRPPPITLKYHFIFLKCLFEYIFCIITGMSCLPYLICSISFSD